MTRRGTHLHAALCRDEPQAKGGRDVRRLPIEGRPGSADLRVCQDAVARMLFGGTIEPGAGVELHDPANTYGPEPVHASDLPPPRSARVRASSSSDFRPWPHDDGDVFINPAHVAMVRPSDGDDQRDRRRGRRAGGSLRSFGVREPIKDVDDKVAPRDARQAGNAGRRRPPGPPPVEEHPFHLPLPCRAKLDGTELGGRHKVSAGASERGQSVDEPDRMSRRPPYASTSRPFPNRQRRSLPKDGGDDAALHVDPPLKTPPAAISNTRCRHLAFDRPSRVNAHLLARRDVPRRRSEHHHRLRQHLSPDPTPRADRHHMLPQLDHPLELAFDLDIPAAANLALDDDTSPDRGDTQRRASPMLTPPGRRTRSGDDIVRLDHRPTRPFPLRYQRFSHPSHLGLSSNVTTLTTIWRKILTSSRSSFLQNVRIPSSVRTRSRCCVFRDARVVRRG